MAEQQAEISKSAKRRAAKKAKEAAETEAPAPPINKETAKGNAEANAKSAAKPAAAPSEPKAQGKAKAKAETKAEPKAEPKAQPKAEPKAQPKAQPKAEAKAALVEPNAAAKPAAKPKQEAAKAKAKPAAKSKAAAKSEEEEEPRKRDPSPMRHIEYDDGTGADWAVSTGMTKKQQMRKERLEAEKAEAAAAGIKPGQTLNLIPGMAPPSAQAAAKAAVTVSQAVAAVPASAVASAAAAAEKEKPPEAPSSTATIKVPEQRIGIVIGPKGATIKLIQEKTGARIDTSGEMFTVTGPPQGVGEAEAAIRELIEKGYTSMQYDDFSEHFVAAHPSSFPDIIGKGGVVIRKIKEELGVSVNIPDAPKTAPAGKKYKVTLAGSASAVEKAKEVINDIIMYYHHPITHPDQVHEEFEVPQWALSFIIGKAGSELRHIQNNYKVRMYIPRDTSVNKNVVIVGEQNGVERAKLYVDKVLWNAEHASKGRDRQEDGDTWGEEGEVEDWMKDYLYKRR